MRLPEFVCIGAQRCGTTTLWDMLQRHPGIFLPEQKELHFFDDRDGFYQRGIEAYAAHFAAARPDQVCGESTPCYLFFPEACERMHAHLPRARLLVILRDPVERARSHYWYSVRRGYEWLGFERALDAEAARLAGGDADARNRFSYVARGRYAEQLRRFERRFSREQLCVLFLEDLKRRPAETLDAVFAHIGVAADPACLARETGNRNLGVHPRVIRLHAWMQAGRRWAGGRTGLRERAVRRVAREVWRWNVREGTPPLSPALRARLEAAFRDSDAELAAWLGRPLPWRATPAPTTAQAPALVASGRNTSSPAAGR